MKKVKTESIEPLIRALNDYCTTLVYTKLQEGLNKRDAFFYN